MHHGAGEPSTVERSPNLVSDSGTGPHDRPRHAALYGGADARPGAVASHRPCAYGYRARPRCRHHPRGHWRSAQRLIIAFVLCAREPTMLEQRTTTVRLILRQRIGAGEAVARDLPVPVDR